MNSPNVNHIQALDTMGKLKEIKDYVRLTPEKLPNIKSDLVRTDDRWHDLDFEELTKELSNWVDRNPVISGPKHDQRREQLLQAKKRDRKLCVYFNVNNHKNSEYENVKGIQDCKKTLSGIKLCFNCTGKEYRASLFKSKRSCQIYQRKHHRSTCHKNIEMMMAAESLIDPVVVVKVNSIMCRAFLDTGAGSSCASAAFLDQLKLKLIKKETT